MVISEGQRIFCLQGVLPVEWLMVVELQQVWGWDSVGRFQGFFALI